MHKHPSLGVVLVLLAAVLWGTTGTAQALASGTLPAVWFGALRLIVAALFFVAYARLAAVPSSTALPLLPVLAAGLCMAVYNLAFFAGVRLTGVALGTAVALGSGPVWAGLLQALWTRRWPAPVWWLGTMVAVTGGVLMSLGGSAGLLVDPLGLGLCLCLLSGLSWGLYSLLNAELVRHMPAGRVTLWAFSVAALLALPLAVWDSGWPMLQVADLAAVLYVGVLTAGVAYLLFSHALRHISAATGVTLALGEPVVAFVLAVLVVGEQPGGWATLGLLLVLAGVGLVVRVELRSAVKPQ